MDYERYRTDPGYRAQVEGGRKGGRSRSPAKLAAVRENIKLSSRRPRKDGLPTGWRQAGLTLQEAEAKARDHKRDQWVAWTEEQGYAWQRERHAGRDREAEETMAAIEPGRDLGEFRAWADDGKPKGGISRPAYLLLARARFKMARDRRRELENFPI